MKTVFFGTVIITVRLSNILLACMGAFESKSRMEVGMRTQEDLIPLYTSL